MLDQATGAEWVSFSEGYERATVYDDGDRKWVTFYLARDVAVLNRAAGHDDTEPAERYTVHEQPATVREGVYDHATVWEVRWQPRPDVYAMVLADDTESFALRVAESIRLDKAQRCVMPLRLTALPPGTTWVECQTRVRRMPSPGQPLWVWSGLTLRQTSRSRAPRTGG